jgi:hypothetical protein
MGEGPLPPDPPSIDDSVFTTGLPYFDALETPNAATGLAPSMDPGQANPDVGALPIVGAYDGAYATVGPAGRPFGYEDQAMGRFMRFPANVPDSYSIHGAHMGPGYLDDLAATLSHGDQPVITDQQVMANLLTFT